MRIGLRSRRGRMRARRFGSGLTGQEQRPVAGVGDFSPVFRSQPVEKKFEVLVVNLTTKDRYRC